MRILLIAGGWSSEREVALAGAEQIRQALERLGHDVLFFDPVQDYGGLLQKAHKCDFAFLNLHGAPGEDGVIQAMLDTIGCPYQGSGPGGSLRALDKAVSKEIFRFHSMPTADWQFLSENPGPSWQPELSPPLFIKPNTGGSSLGMAHITKMEDLRPALKETFTHHSDAILEAFITGEELTCAILGEDPLPLVQIKPKRSHFFNYESKYEQGGAEEICPAPVDSSLTAEIQKLAVKAHRVLGLKDYSRADFIVGDKGPFILEVNTLPGMTQTSLLPQAARAAGYSFEDLIAKLIELGMAKHATSKQP